MYRYVYEEKNFIYILTITRDYTISKVQRTERQKERRAGLKIQGDCTRRDSPTSFRKLSYYISHWNPFQRGTHANVPLEISAFLDRAVLTVLFAVRLLPLNSLTFHSLDASAYGHLSFSLLLLLSYSQIRLFSRCLFFSIQSVHPHAPEHRALVEAFVRRSRHTRKYTRAGRGCISMYFYARVIAPTVYFYPIRVICNGPPSDPTNGEKEGIPPLVALGKMEGKRLVDSRIVRSLLGRDARRHLRSEIYSQHRPRNASSRYLI